MIIKFQGDYFSTMNYLQAIESLPWRISWDRLEYKVIEYPNSRSNFTNSYSQQSGGMV